MPLGVQAVFNRYRIIYFIPNLKHESRYALAALVETEGGLHIVRAERKLCPCCFDFNVNKTTVAKKLLSDMEMRHIPNNIEVKEILFTEHLSVGRIRRYPAMLLDPDEWLRKHILPR